MDSKTVRTLGVWMNGERVGSWIEQVRQQQMFIYDNSWASSPSARPISLSLPLISSDGLYTGSDVENFFNNLLPDSADIRRRIQRRFGCPSDSAFDLLTEIGRDCVGALQFLPQDQEPMNVHTIEAKPLADAEIARYIRGVTNDVVPGASFEESFRISLAGAQEKTAFLFHDGSWCIPLGTTPTSHIFKLPLGRIGAMQADMSASIENEWLCLQILDAFGLSVAKTEIASFEDQKVLVVERFDRRYAPDGTWLMRIPQEDLCQATGTPPSKKYETEGGPGIPAILDVLLGSHESLHDRKRFLKAQILFWLLAAPDGHAKNFSIFLEQQGRFTLTPVYDVMSVYPILGHGREKLPPEKLRMAMAVQGSSRHYEWAKIQRRHWETTGRICGSRMSIDEVMEEVIRDTPQVIQKVTEKLPQHFPEYIADSIFTGLETMINKCHKSE